VFHIGINLLSGKRTPSSNSSYKVKVLLSSKREKRRVTKAKGSNAHQTDKIKNQNDNSSDIY